MHFHSLLYSSPKNTNNTPPTHPTAPQLNYMRQGETRFANALLTRLISLSSCCRPVHSISSLAFDSPLRAHRSKLIQLEERERERDLLRQAGVQLPISISSSSAYLSPSSLSSSSSSSSSITPNLSTSLLSLVSARPAAPHSFLPLPSRERGRERGESDGEKDFENANRKIEMMTHVRESIFMSGELFIFLSPLLKAAKHKLQ
jgi:hypothetical protein